MPGAPLMPPAELIGHASGTLRPDQFVKTGQEFLNYFRDYANLQPSARVLDLGCGCGRIAIPLAGYLDRTGVYDGIDVDQRSIDWANDAISGRYPNFRFQRADIRNTTYNPGGAVTPHEYRLPFADGTFDFAFLASVFTHMLPNAMENYLGEVSRVLKVGGKCLITMFLLNDESRQQIHAGLADFDFPHRQGICAVHSVERPEDVVAYDEPAVRRVFRRNGLGLTRPIIFGHWTGRADGVCFQDMIVARKRRGLGLLGRTLRRLLPLAHDIPRFEAEPTLARPKQAA